jgi:predicted dehydrogenase
MASSTSRLRVAIIGTARRSSYMYGPILKALPDDVELVAVWGRSEDSARHLGDVLDVPWYTDLDLLIAETEPVIGIVSVAYSANGIVGRMAVEHGLHVLLETPIAHDLDEADAIIRIAEEKELKIEVAEQFHRRPLEQIKLKLLATGLFGEVYVSFNDYAGHGYHGISVMRSYLGFDAKPLRVTGAVHQYDLMPHWSMNADTFGPRRETQEHGMIEFEGGQLGIFHWTDVGYDSALRWWRSSRFMAEKGMGITVGVGLDVQEQLSLLAPGGQAPQFITLERRWERCDGGALVAMVAHTGDPDHPIVTWENPFRPVRKGHGVQWQGRGVQWQGHGVQWHDDEIGVAACLMSLVDAVRDKSEPTYGPYQARLDQELILAIRQSAAMDGAPVTLPLS